MWDVLALALSLAPAVFAGVWGQRLVRGRDDPAIAERLAAYRSRLVQVTAVSLVGASVLTTAWVGWPFVVGIAAVLVAGFPARRALHGEAWSLAAYLSHVIRFWVAAGAFWFALILAPMLVQAAGPARWSVAALLAVLLLAWEVYHPLVFRRLMRATPLERPDLAPGFATVLSRARIRAPRLYRAGTPGGRWVNAFALPSWREPSVLFMDTLLAEFDAAEIAAIFGHEVAHLEHHDRRRLLRLSAVNWAGIVLAVLVVPVLIGRFPDGTTLEVVWTSAVVGLLLTRSVRHKAHEAESDRRAVVLCGDAPALVRALVKLHALMRLPRRWGVDFERAASHPSLAHRIHAIEAAAGLTAAPAGAAVVVAGRATGAFVVFDADRLHRLEGVPASAAAATGDAGALRAAAAAVQSVPYAELTDVRVRSTLRGIPSLSGTDRTGRTWSAPLRSDAVAAAQAALDRVDGQLIRVPMDLVHHPLLNALLTFVVVLLSLPAAGSWVVALPAAVALLRQSSAALAAVGTAALAAALLARYGPATTPPTGRQTLAWLALLAVSGGLALLVAFRRLRTDPETGPRPGLVSAGLLGAPTLLWWGALAWAALVGGAVGLAQEARALPGAVIAPLAAAAALAALPHRRARAGALAAAAVAMVPLVAGTGWFVDHVARDPLLGPAPPVTWRRGAARLDREATFADRIGSLRLSPSGEEYVVRPYPRGGGRREWRQFRVGRFGGASRRVEADAVEFARDGRLLLMTHGAGELELRMVAADDPGVTLWRRAVPALAVHEVIVDAATGAWRLAGSDTTGQLTALAGIAGADAVEARSWPLPESLDADASYLVGPAGVLALRVDWGGALPGWAMPFAGWLWPVVPSVRRASELWLVDGAAPRRVLTTQLSVSCRPPVAARSAFACVAYDGDRARLWAVDQAGGTELLAVLPGRVAHAQGADGRIAVWSASEVSIVGPGERTGLRLALPARTAEVVLQAGRLATITNQLAASVVRVYEIEP